MSSCFSRCLRVPIAIRAFYESGLWILQTLLLKHPDLHPGLLVAKSVSSFLYDFVLLLWPTQPMAMANLGRGAAAALSVGANLLLFTALGVVVGILGRTCTRTIVGYIVVCGLIFWFDLWGAGFSFEYLNLLALEGALFVYAIPFWVVMRAPAMPKSA
jgi:hypothetical protein